MEIENLINNLNRAADDWEEKHPVTYTGNLRVQDALRDAASALSTLQADNDKLRYDVIRFNDMLASYQNVLVPELRVELEKVKAERDAAINAIPHTCETCLFHAVTFNGCTPDHDCTNPDGTLRTTKAQRTGCSMCGFGIHLEKRPHRFDLLRESNPKEWEYWMLHCCKDENGTEYGWGRVLDYIGVEWRQEMLEGF